MDQCYSHQGRAIVELRVRCLASLFKRVVHLTSDGQGAFEQWPGLVRLAQVPQDQGKVAQAGGDGGMAGSVGSFVDGQGAFEQWPGVVWLAQVPQHGSEVVQNGGDGGVVWAVGSLG